MNIDTFAGISHHESRLMCTVERREQKCTHSSLEPDNLEMVSTLN